MISVTNIICDIVAPSDYIIYFFLLHLFNILHSIIEDLRYITNNFFHYSV